jgi:ferredoxin, 2Fe-2S
MTQALGETTHVHLTYVETSGKSCEIRAEVGVTLMRVATANLVRGIDGDCGGNAACGTCLTRVDESIRTLLPPPSEDELDLIAGLGVPTSGHRLACQIPVTPQLNGCTFHVGQLA